MKRVMLGCVLGAAAGLVLPGCLTYDSSYVATTGESDIVERRLVLIEGRERTVPIYRSGDVYYYTWGGRRYPLADYPSLTGAEIAGAPAYSGSRYRASDGEWVARDLDERRQIRRSSRRLDVDAEQDLSLKW